MAATLQDQWNAVYGPTPIDATRLNGDSTHFVQRTSIAVSAQAVTVSQEPTTTTNHANRVALAKAALNNPTLFAIPFAQAMASQGLDQSSTDAQILNAVGVGWNYFAGVP